MPPPTTGSKVFPAGIKYDEYNGNGFEDSDILLDEQDLERLKNLRWPDFTRVFYNIDGVGSYQLRFAPKLRELVADVAQKELSAVNSVSIRIASGPDPFSDDNAFLAALLGQDQISSFLAFLKDAALDADCMLPMLRKAWRLKLSLCSGFMNPQKWIDSDLMKPRCNLLRSFNQKFKDNKLRTLSNRGISDLRDWMAILWAGIGKQPEVTIGGFVVDSAHCFAKQSSLGNDICGNNIIGARYYALFLEWQTLGAVNEVLRDRNKWSPLVFAACPVLYCYLMRLFFVRWKMPLQSPYQAKPQKEDSALEDVFAYWAAWLTEMEHSSEYPLRYSGQVQTFIERSPFKLEFYKGTESVDTPLTTGSYQRMTW